MPEGDTIFRAARTLRAALAGREVTAVRTTVAQVRALGPQRLVGQTVAAVESRGKHLLIWFDPSDLALHTHLRMSGAWHTAAAGERPRRPPATARLVLEAGAAVATCFAAPVVELLSRSQVERHPSLAALGPDALADDVDLAEARRRLDLRAEVTIAEAMLDQRVLAGIGNVYRAELLFLHSLDPWTPVGAVAPETRDALLASAVRLLRANVATPGFNRVTTRDPDAVAAGRVPRRRSDALAVYGKAGRPCPRCGTAIRSWQVGTQARRVWWCPRCQGPGPRTPGVS